MKFKSIQYMRSGTIRCKGSIREVFPLLCPKREEEWIPGWECETIWSGTGYNEEGAIFRTTKPYETELYWSTLQYDVRDRIVDFLITAPHLYVLRFKISISSPRDGNLEIVFKQVFTSISEDGGILIERYQREDYDAKLKNLETYLNDHLGNNPGPIPKAGIGGEQGPNPGASTRPGK